MLHAERIETGILAVSGKLSLNDSVRTMTPPAVFRGPTLILGPKGCFLFANAVEYVYTKPKDTNTQDSVSSADSSLPLANREEYLLEFRCCKLKLARRRLRPARRIRQFDRDGCRTAGFSRLARIL